LPVQVLAIKPAQRHKYKPQAIQIHKNKTLTR